MSPIAGELPRTIGSFAVVGLAVAMLGSKSVVDAADRFAVLAIVLLLMSMLAMLVRIARQLARMS